MIRHVVVFVGGMVVGAVLMALYIGLTDMFKPGRRD